MGALAIIDDLRHRERVIKEHLDLPERRAEVVRRIREYYQRQQLEVDEQLVEKGVREFFSRRLVFEAPQLDRLQTWLADGVVRRRVWRRKLLNGLVAAGLCVVLLVSVLQLKRVLDANELKRASESQHTLDAILSDLQHQIERYTSLDQADRLPAFDKQALDLKVDLESGQRLLQVDLRSPVTEHNRDLLEERASVYLRSYKPLVDKLHNDLIQVTPLYEYSSQTTWLKATLASSAFVHGVVRYPQLAARADAAGQAHRALARDAYQQLQAFGQLLQQLPEFDDLAARVQPALDAFRVLKLSAADRAQVAAMGDQAHTALQAMDIAALRSAVERLTGTLALAKPALSLDIVSRDAEKSAVERTWHTAEGQAAGKAWFAIVQARDAAGNVLPVPITDSESGKRAMASVFGVRISAEQYQRLKEDKMNDGHLDDAHMGDKPADALGFAFGSKALTSNPDMILRW